MEYVTLINGVKMPIIGYGTYQTPARITEKCVAEALKAGYRSIDTHCKVFPTVNQVETHVFRQQKKLRKLECQIGTKHESWSPLACGQNNIWNNQVLVKIAKNHNKSVSQIALRFLVQQGIIVIPKSINPQHMEENISVLDFDLKTEEIQAIQKLEVGRSLFGWW